MVPFVNVHVSAVKRTVVLWSVVRPIRSFWGLYHLWNFDIVFCMYVYNLLLCSFIKYSNFSVFCVLNVTTSLPHANLRSLEIKL